MSCYPTSAQREIFHSLGDVNRDGIIDDADQQLINNAWESTPGSPNWNPDADLNGDGIVDMNDATILAQHFGLDICIFFGISGPPIPDSGQGTLHVNPVNENELPNGTISFSPEAVLSYSEGTPEFDYILGRIGTWNYYVSPQLTISGTVTVDVTTKTIQGEQTGSGQSTSSMTAYIYGWAPDSPNYQGCTAFVTFSTPSLTVPSVSAKCTVHAVGSGDINFNKTATTNIYVVPYPDDGTPQYSNVTITVAGQGTTDPVAGSYATAYQQGTDLVITATPDIGWYLGGIKRNGTYITGNTITNLGATENIEVVFVEEGQPPPDGGQPDYTLAGIAVAGAVIVGGAYIASKRKKK